MKEKKINNIFKILFLVELGFITLFLILGDKCGYACDPHSLLNPFGTIPDNTSPIYCVEVCKYTPHTLFYIFADLFIVSILVYLVYIIVRRIKK